MKDQIFPKGLSFPTGTESGQGKALSSAWQGRNQQYTNKPNQQKEKALNPHLDLYLILIQRLRFYGFLVLDS